MQDQITAASMTGGEVRAALAAGILRDVLLKRHGISSEAYEGCELALVSVRVGLMVWCDGERYWWRTTWNAQLRQAVYAWHPAGDPHRAADRVALFYTEITSSDPATAEPSREGTR